MLRFVSCNQHKLRSSCNQRLRSGCSELLQDNCTKTSKRMLREPEGCRSFGSLLFWSVCNFSRSGLILASACAGLFCLRRSTRTFLFNLLWRAIWSFFRFDWVLGIDNFGDIWRYLEYLITRRLWSRCLKGRDCLCGELLKGDLWDARCVKHVLWEFMQGSMASLCPLSLQAASELADLTRRWQRGILMKKNEKQREM